MEKIIQTKNIGEIPRTSARIALQWKNKMGISDGFSNAEKGFTGTCTEIQAKNGEYKIDIIATWNYSYHYTFLDEQFEGRGHAVFDTENIYFADYFREPGHDQ